MTDPTITFLPPSNAGLANIAQTFSKSIERHNEDINLLWDYRDHITKLVLDNTPLNLCIRLEWLTEDALSMYLKHLEDSTKELQHKIDNINDHLAGVMPAPEFS